MELREDPRVRARAVSDDEEEEEFQDSREDQFDQIPVSNLNPPPALDLGRLVQSSWVFQVYQFRVGTKP